MGFDGYPVLQIRHRLQVEEIARAGKELERVKDELSTSEEGEELAALCGGGCGVPDLRGAAPRGEPRFTSDDTGAFGAEKVALELDGGEA